MKRILTAAGIALFSSGAFAQGIPTFDTTAVAKALEQIANQMEQIEQLKAQLAQAKELYDSMNQITGVGDLAGLLKSENIQQALPPEFSKLQGPLQGVLKNNFDAFEERNKYTKEAADDFYYKELARARGETNTDMSVGQTIYEAAGQRISGLEQLRDKVKTAATAKEVADLQARISGESSLIQNQILQMQGLAMIQQARDRVDDERKRENFLDMRRRIKEVGVK
ncbi:P-type DNA transfer protein VirB5 [Neorhizobium sp. T786]|uniref:P-type DNA transfer protein VirB5 n=1 Tax=Pseudorhizobium xiangyangii TaxID=2883104 RepID=UPI001CFF5E2C|nr:P-type DNA transfer protein VirB5 [Neorhizobium xiangyangii]MCB5205163.1 P-type DNA transfer protein VirB5 [Neorhizobium xiangyangii]